MPAAGPDAAREETEVVIKQAWSFGSTTMWG
jgi:hypothetical protein